MQQRQVFNGVIVVAVIALVVTVARYRTERTPTRPDPPAAPARGVPVTRAGGAAAEVTTTQPVATDPPASAPAAAKVLPRLLDLGADKCKACKAMAPILEELRAEYDGRAVVDFIDVWKNGDAAGRYAVKLIPTQIFFDRDGREVWRHVGFLSKEEIVAKFAELGVR